MELLLTGNDLTYEIWYRIHGFFRRVLLKGRTATGASAMSSVGVKRSASDERASTVPVVIKAPACPTAIPVNLSDVLAKFPVTTPAKVPLETISPERRSVRHSKRTLRAYPADPLLDLIVECSLITNVATTDPLANVSPTYPLAETRRSWFPINF